MKHCGHCSNEMNPITVFPATPALLLEPARHADPDFLLKLLNFFRLAVTQHRCNQSFTPAMTSDKIHFFTGAFDLAVEMGQGKIAHQIEMHAKHRCGRDWDDVEFLAFSTCHVRTRDGSLKLGHLATGLAPGASKNTVRIKGDIADCVDTLFVALQIFIHRTSARTAEGSV